MNAFKYIKQSFVIVSTFIIGLGIVNATAQAQTLNSEMCFGTDTRRAVKLVGGSKYPMVCKGLCHPPNTAAVRLSNGTVLGWGNIPGGRTITWAYKMDASQPSPANYCPQDVLHATYQ